MGQSNAAPEPSKPERVGVSVTSEEMTALKELVALYPERFDGAASVLREYSVREAVALSQDRKRRLEAIGA